MRALMQFSPAAFLLMVAVSGGAVYSQPATNAVPSGPQPAAAVQPAKSPAAPAPAVAPATVNPPSSLLKPSLSSVQDTLNNLRLERWKKGSVRDEASDHISSLLKDMQTNLPPLMTTADAAPGSVSQSMPLIKHLDAFYDVLLRVEEAARVSAPSDQVSALQQTMLQLNQSRLALDDRLQTEAVAQEKATVDLLASVKTLQQTNAQYKAQVASAAATPQPCKPATPAKKKPVVKKPATTAPAANTPATSTPAKPSAGQPQGQQNQPQGQKGQPQGKSNPQNQPQGSSQPKPQ
jgi:hypothetical protein